MILFIIVKQEGNYEFKREDLKLNKWIKDLLDEIKYSCVEKKIYIECKNKMERENILDNLYP